MRPIVTLLSLSLGLLTAACADQSALGPSSSDDNTMSAATASTSGSGKTSKGGVGGTAGGIKGTGK